MTPAYRILRALARFDLATGAELLEATGGSGSANAQRLSRVLRTAVADGLRYRITATGRAWLAASAAPSPTHSI